MRRFQARHYNTEHLLPHAAGAVPSADIHHALVPRDDAPQSSRIALVRHRGSAGVRPRRVARRQYLFLLARRLQPHQVLSRVASSTAVFPLVRVDHKRWVFCGVWTWIFLEFSSVELDHGFARTTAVRSWLEELALQVIRILARTTCVNIDYLPKLYLMSQWCSDYPNIENMVAVKINWCRPQAPVFFRG